MYLPVADNLVLTGEARLSLVSVDMGGIEGHKNIPAWQKA